MFLLRSFLIYTLFLCNTVFADINERPIYFTSIPKTGTHLLGKCLELLTGKKQQSNNEEMTTKGVIDLKKIQNLKNQFTFHQHLIYQPTQSIFLKKMNFIIFFMFRDPRDQTVSLAYWIKLCPNLYGEASKFSISDLITKIINKEFNSNLSTPAYLGWLKDPGVCSIKFENLVGPNGGGSRQKQIKEITKIANHLKLKVTPNKIKEIASNLWGNSGTFRSGKIGSWRTHFTERQKNIFKSLAGQLLIDLGYEKDFNW